jgi:enoyl-CoA hydratase
MFFMYIGGALELIASCDMRIAKKDTVFSMPEVPIGIPSVVHAARLPLLIGWGRARRLVYTGEKISAQTALSWGLVDGGVDGGSELFTTEEELQAEASRLAKMIVDGGPRAIKLQKELIHRWERGMDMTGAVDAGIEVFGKAFETDEPRRLMSKVLDSLKH